MKCKNQMENLGAHGRAVIKWILGRADVDWIQLEEDKMEGVLVR
jgi:hypothetical protein